ncbi:serine/threonine-protein kinase, partial [Frankia sp. CiP3]|uniref:serine/threonine-protein kinase n=1 Tax=Frankia sp. CiP3 TaxID=2880971 RepID=UPI001EF51457
MIVDRGRIVAALPGYEIGGDLGAGAFGLVVAGRHRTLNRPVAIKVLPAGPDAVAARFAHEAELLARIDHPHVVRVYDYVETDALRLIVMELLPGGTLTRRRRGMTARGACAVGLAAAAALHCAHTHGVLHRDVKPDNMMFGADDLLKVTDFGIAKPFEAGAEATASAVVGTPIYMAPEQIVGGRLGPATDLYALGVVLYHLLSGVLPVDPGLPVHMVWHHRLHTPPPPPPGVAPPVAAVLLRALAREPGERQESALAFALDLARAAADAYGPRWTAGAGMPLRVDDEIRAAADHPAGRTSTPVTARERPPPAAEPPDPG